MYVLAVKQLGQSGGFSERTFLEKFISEIKPFLAWREKTRGRKRNAKQFKWQ